AGITKYKAQKKEALRKLEATDANLIRVTDIIREVKRQIGSLQRQAGKARRYQALISDLKTLDTHFSKRQLNALEATLAGTRAEVERLTALQHQHQQQIDSDEGGLADKRRALE